MALTTHITRTSDIVPRLSTARVSSGTASTDTAPAVGDRVAISHAGRQQLQGSASGQASTGSAEESRAGQALLPPDDLDTTAQQALQALRQRDREVRLHEQAHLLTAGPFAKGAPQYTYQTGPDGKRYAVGGAVPIDLSAIPGDPQATVQKALTIRRAALAPADPSGADLAVAAKAAALAVRAQQELTRLQTADTRVVPANRTVQNDQGAASSPQVRHVCGPNCQEHDAQRSAGTLLQASGDFAPARALAGALAMRAVASYQRAGRVATQNVS